MSHATDFNLAAIAEAVADAVPDREFFVFLRDPTVIHSAVGTVQDTRERTPRRCRDRR